MPRTPLWTAIETALTEDIAEGRYASGDRLPSEAALAARFGVNRHTVRRALAALAEAGLVHARRGAGVFVQHAPTEYPIGRRTRFHRNLAAAGRLPAREIRLLETRAADAREAEALNLAPGDPALVCEGRSLADNQPLALFRSVFPAARLPGLEPALRELSSVTAALARAGVPDYTRRVTRVTARAATATQAAQLRVPEGAPLLRSVAVNTDPEGTPVEFGTTWFAGDRVTLTVSEPGEGPDEGGEQADDPADA
ncbi:phosphonate metabolism transcriptional regulator PhnF [Rhodosalinus sediminis]|uniref:Phosphonate metabolism transcriptional regulator PhnF n=1 Tax=Rhodosalinus sediminis TaxID=1940533 RepID=A0A3D9BUW2_9RHOB|nr:phosphonate metabolism transcriptional regulator PhnF [Rhodosalinus sediminis]REC57324.1 phosphonate metabolism transcriptional regulator PhnF [Rhodosalinus sediminis]